MEYFVIALLVGLTGLFVWEFVSKSRKAKTIDWEKFQSTPAAEEPVSTSSVAYEVIEEEAVVTEEPVAVVEAPAAVVEEKKTRKPRAPKAEAAPVEKKTRAPRKPEAEAAPVEKKTRKPRAK